MRIIHSAIVTMCLFAMISAASGDTGSPDCIDYGDSVHWEDSFDLQAEACVISGDHLYVASGEDGFRILSFRPPASLVELAAISGLGHVTNVVLSGNVACIASDTLSLVRVDDPQRPVLVGGYAPGFMTDAMAAKGDIIFICNMLHILQSVDISTPSAPRLVRETGIQANMRALSMAVGGDLLFLGCNSGLQIFDVSDPTSPSYLSHLMIGTLEQVLVDGDLVFGVDFGGQKVHVIDVSDPTNPMVIGVWGKSGILAISGNIAFQACGFEGVRVLDLSDPIMPRLLATIPTNSFARTIAAGGGFAVSGTGLALETPRLETIDARGLESLEPIAYLDLHLDLMALALKGDLLLAAVEGSGVYAIDVLDPGTPRVTCQLDTGYWLTDIEVVGELAFVADETAGLSLVDVSDPYSLQLEGQLGGLLDLQCVTGNDTLAVTGAADGILYFVDVSDPVSPGLIGQFEVPGVPRDLASVEGFLYVAAQDSGLIVVDIRQPDNPAVVDIIPTPGLALGLSRSDRMLAVSCGNGGVLLVGIEDPYHPVIYGSHPTSGNTMKTVFDGPYAYCAEWEHGIKVLDVLASPGLGVIGYIDTPGYARDVVVGSDAVFVADDTGGLQIIQRQCGQQVPVVLSSFHVHPVGGINLAMWTVASGWENANFRLLGRSGATEWVIPHIMIGDGTFQAEDDSGAVKDSRSITYSLYFESRLGQWQILKEITLNARPPAPRTRFLSTNPNPFNPHTSIRFVCASPGQVRITVHDMAGRLLAMLLDEAMAPGTHAIDWDGRDFKGRPAASGPYLIRLVSDGTIDVRKVTLIR